MATQQERAQQLFGGPPQSMGALDAVKEAVLAVAPGLRDAGQEIKEELTHKAAQGAHELAAALFSGNAFVMYPRGGKDDHGIHGPEQSQNHAPDHTQGNQETTCSTPGPRPRPASATAARLSPTATPQGWRRPDAGWSTGGCGLAPPPAKPTPRSPSLTTHLRRRIDPRARSSPATRRPTLIARSCGGVMLCAFITLVVILAALGGLAFLAGRRRAAHVQHHPDALRAIADPVLLPILIKRPEEPPPPAEDEAKPKPEVKRVKGTLIAACKREGRLPAASLSPLRHVID